jgi:hypothetical protein
MKQEQHINGSCLCGGVRNSLSGPLLAAEHCHCSMCRKAHGAAFSSNALVASEHLHLISGEALLSQYASSPNRLKCFCSRCGSQLFIRRLNAPELTVVTLGTLIEDPGLRPQRHVFVDSKAEWFDLDAELPRYRIYPGYEPEE